VLEQLDGHAAQQLQGDQLAGQGVVERPLGPLWVETSGEIEDGTSGTSDWDAFDLGAMVRREVARVVYDGDPTNSAGRGPAPAHMHLGGREAR